MILLKFLLAIVGLVVVAAAVLCFLGEITQELGLLAGLLGAALVFFVFRNDAVMDFFGVSGGLIDDIAFGAMIGGGIICAIDLEKLGAAMITAGWIAVGLILMQVVPIPFISEFLQVASLPFVIACIPLLLILLIFI